METALLMTSIVTFAIFLTIIISLAKGSKTLSFKKREIPLIILSLTYLVFTITLILWVTDFLIFDKIDLLAVFSLTLIVQTACLLFIIYDIKKSKKILYTLVPFSLIIPLILYSPNLIHLAIPISLLSTLIVFLSLANIHGKTTRYMILYTSTSIILYLLASLWTNLTTTLILISSILFLGFIIPFLRLLQLVPRQIFKLNGKEESPFMHFMKHLIFIIIITNFVFIGTVSIHEFGHLLTSSESDCQETRIIYELEGLPHTEVKCENTENKNIWTLGGIFFPLIIAAFLLFGGGKFIKELAVQMIGFDLIISYLDFIFLGLSKTIATFMLMLGVAITAFSLWLLVKSRVE